MTPKGHCSLAWLALLCSALRSAFRIQFREGRIHARPPSALVVLHSHAPSSSVTAARGSFRRERERTTTTTTSEFRPARNASFWNAACNRASSCVYFSVPVPRHPSPRVLLPLLPPGTEGRVTSSTPSTRGGAAGYSKLTRG